MNWKGRMPFKLKLRKTRNYSIISKNILVISVELIDKTTFEFTFPSDCTGLNCLHTVCQRLNIHQSEFFGLRYVSKRPYPKVRWVELERPLKKQLDKYAQSPGLGLAVQYYIHDVGLLQDDTTRSHYFVQVKHDVLEGKIKTNYEQAVLLASYSLQAEFGDHQRGRHTPEYLKDFRLFPKQVVNEGEAVTLLEAVVWQYASLIGLGQALAETYYILEAQRLPGYGQETFIARDEKGSEIYLGASLLGITIQSASGETHTFYRWNSISNLINQKRNFGIECSIVGGNTHFTFDEPDAAKYVWKMCVKQHTFYKGNQDILDGVAGDSRSLALPDLQSSVMDSTYRSSHANSALDMTNPSFHSDRTFEEQINSRFNSKMLNMERSFASNRMPEPTDATQFRSSEPQNQLRVMSQSVTSLNDSPFTLNQSHQPPMTQQFATPANHPQGIAVANQASSANPMRLHQSHSQSSLNHHPQNALVSHITPQETPRIEVYTEPLNDPNTSSFRRKLLPQYRPAPDYATAVLEKYGGGVATNQQQILFSSQPDISEPKDADETANKADPVTYGQHRGFQEHIHRSSIPTPKPTGNLTYTYSSPDLAQAEVGSELRKELLPTDVECHFIHGDKPPPPYPYSKPSSNSTPDLASACKAEQRIADAYRKRSLLTASLGCLGSPDLSRTYENLTELGDVVESLRKELTRTNNRPSFLHSVPPNYSQDNLDAIYQLSNGKVAVSIDPRDSANSNYSLQQQTSSPQLRTRKSIEPIYQNVDAILASIHEQKRARAKSTSELELVCRSLGLSTNALQAEANANLKPPPPYQAPLLTVSPEDSVRTRAVSHPPPSADGPLGMPSLAQSQPYSPKHVPEKAQRLSVEHIASLNPLLSQPPPYQTHNIPHPIEQQNQETFIAESLAAQRPLEPKLVPASLNSPIVKMGSVTSCLSTEDRKNKPDILPDNIPTKMVSKDPRVIDLDTKLNSMEIVNEFEHVPRTKFSSDFTSATLSENLCRNQYKDIIPYEENRVKITPSKENKTGYINASHITATVGSTQRFYICSQGPLANTVGHFWQCVWESDVRLIVMLNSVAGDSGTSKSFPYWPLSDNTSVECDQYRIYRKHSTKSSYHITCRLQLVNVAQRQSRSVWHLQFTHWADHGCPEDVQSFITFMEEMSSLRRVTYNEVEGVGRNRNTPVLVHCSAGVGRSGVTILCDILMETADHNQVIDVPKVLHHLRQQRMCLVQSFNQYKFVYRVLLSYLQKSRLI